MTETRSSAQVQKGTGAPPKLGLALVVIATAQLMVILDSTITNIALPSIQADLGISASGLAWIVNSYVLAFGGLLLLGGRSGDLFGRRRMFRVGIAIFTLASLLGGLAPNAELLIAARILQGVGAAIAAPTALSLIATTFPEGGPRNKAMGVYAAMSGIGSTIGLLLGGVLTDYLDWRWIFFVNIPIGIALLIGTKILPAGERARGRLDIPGAITGTLGLVSLVYGITRGGEHGWTTPSTLMWFGLAVALLIAFIAVQRRSDHPMMPLRILADRNRSGSYASMLIIGAAMFAMFYFLSLFMQQVLGFSPIQTGLAYLPFSLGMGLATGLGSALAGRVAPRMLAGPGMIVAAAGMTWFAFLEPDSSYLTHLMPAMFVTAAGLGISFLPMTLGAVSGVSNSDAGIASALLSTAQQIGGAMGLAILSTVATNSANSTLPDADSAYFEALGTGDQSLLTQASAAMTDGFTSAFVVAAGLLIVGAAVTMTTINAKPHTAKDAPVHVG
ncbi:MFS transporter [Rhodococcus sp. OK302]|uniref:MFS transporter n=1 Tax=Rhodococcus sp. OK302 TaxID=1882769 RepID=UPI000B9410A2|nr:MFS transporter [Rhodococcus sp. OK302]OYD66531.1 EmrB/QacA subfamily drug resistance transporter [Rhodococcus sp. OK302]